MSSSTSASASAIVTDKVSGHHVLKIDGVFGILSLPSRESVTSCPFTVGDHVWRISCYPGGIQPWFQEGAAETAAPRSVSVPPSDLNRHLGGLLETGKGADVVFEVAGHKFSAHRWLLASRSPVFNAEFFGAMKESDVAAGVVRTGDMEAGVFKAFLSFMYTDSLPEMAKKEEDAMYQHLLVAADRYNMERLKLICEDKLCKRVDGSTVANVLALAELHHCRDLKDACLEFLSTPANLREAMATDGFEHLSTSCPSVVKELIAMCSAP